MSDDKDLLERADALLHKYASQALRMETSAAPAVMLNNDADIPVLTEAIEWIDTNDAAIPTLTESLDLAASPYSELDLNADFESTLAAIASAEAGPAIVAEQAYEVAKEPDTVIQDFDFSDQEWHAIEETYDALTAADDNIEPGLSADVARTDEAVSPPTLPGAVTDAAEADILANPSPTVDVAAPMDFDPASEAEAFKPEMPKKAPIDVTPSFEPYASRWNVDAAYADDFPSSAPAQNGTSTSGPAERVTDEYPSNDKETSIAADAAYVDDVLGTAEDGTSHADDPGEALNQVTDTLTERALRELDQHLKEILEREIAPRLVATLDKSLSALLEQFSMHIEEMVSECVRNELRKQFDKDNP